jgi:hypothetical protein
VATPGRLQARDEHVYSKLVEAVREIDTETQDNGLVKIHQAPAALVAEKMGWEVSTARSRLVPLSRAGLVQHHPPSDGQKRFWLVVMPAGEKQLAFPGSQAGESGKHPASADAADKPLLFGLDEITQKLPALLESVREEAHKAIGQLIAERDAALAERDRTNAAFQEVLAGREAAEAERDEALQRVETADRKLAAIREALEPQS